MTTVNTSSNVTSPPVGDSTSFILTAKAGIRICSLISTFALVNLGSEIYQDPSFLNPWSDRCSQISWFSPDHLRYIGLAVPMMISGVLMDMVAKEEAKLAKV